MLFNIAKQLWQKNKNLRSKIFVFISKFGKIWNILTVQYFSISVLLNLCRLNTFLYGWLLLPFKLLSYFIVVNARFTFSDNIRNYFSPLIKFVCTPSKPWGLLIIRLSPWSRVSNFILNNLDTSAAPFKTIWQIRHFWPDIQKLTKLLFWF